MQPTAVIDRRTALSQHFFFHRLDPVKLDQVLKLAVERSYSNNQVIFQRGDEGSSLMAVLRGRVKISACSDDGKEIILTTLMPGDVFGEMSLIDGKERSADATALDTCTLLILHRYEFIPFLRQTPDVSILLLMQLCEKIRHTNEIVETIGLHPIPARLARLLLKLSGEESSESPEGRRVKLTLSQRELGSTIGATRESVNKQLRAWQKEGLIAMRGSTIVILEEEQLEQQAGLAW